MNKRIVSIVLSLVLLLSVTSPAFAATKTSTKTITFQSYVSGNKDFTGYSTTLKVTNVISQKVKDFSFYLTDDKVTISGKKSNVFTCKVPTSLILQPNKGEKHIRVISFSGGCDANKVDLASVKFNCKYYAFDEAKGDFNFSKKYTDSNKPDKCGIAEGSSQTITKAGTYVVYVRPLCKVNDKDVPLTPVFIVAKK